MLVKFLVLVAFLQAVKSAYSSKNFALGKNTAQSSTAHGGVSSRAVDGNRNGDYGDESCTHTLSSRQPWWRVDLGRQIKVSSVFVSNRADCCWDRLSNFEVRVGNSFAINNNPLCGARHSLKRGQTEIIYCNPSLKGRFVSISLKKLNGGILTLCEVEVYAVSSPNTHNLALGKSTAQSSTAHGGVSSRAVDGNRNGNYGDLSCTHTLQSKQPWWRVDLGKQINIGSVLVSNRADCCWDRLSNFEVRVGNSLAINKNPLCGGRHSLKRGQTEIIYCYLPLYGRYVSISLPSLNVGYLTLCEVEIYSVFSPNTHNLALGKNTAQSSTAHGGVSSRAVDGNKNGKYVDNSCTHTLASKQTWWKVDLGKQVKVRSVFVSNRADCCWYRLSNFEVRVGNSLANSNNPRCGGHYSARRGQTEVIYCNPPLNGRFLSISMQNVFDIPLTLCEVEVYAAPNV